VVDAYARVLKESEHCFQIRFESLYLSLLLSLALRELSPLAIMSINGLAYYRYQFLFRVLPGGRVVQRTVHPATPHPSIQQSLYPGRDPYRGPLYLTGVWLVQSQESNLCFSESLAAGISNITAVTRLKAHFRF
jgi:hypothetical protein